VFAGNVLIIFVFWKIWCDDVGGATQVEANQGVGLEAPLGFALVDVPAMYDLHLDDVANFLQLLILTKVV
jgi:hypothetical protein